MPVQFPRIVQNRSSRHREKYSIEDLARRSIFENLINYFRSGYLDEVVLSQSLQSLFPDVSKHKIIQLMPKIKKLVYVSKDEGDMDAIWDQIYE